MLKTNEKSLVSMAVQGTVAPAVEWMPFEIAHDGKLHAVPSTGSITYNVQVGDKACGWRGDHIEPGVSSKCTDSGKRQSNGYNYLSCVGNEVKVISGEAKGAKGTVVGTHGGVEHVMIDFPQKTLDKLTLDDKFLIRTYGQGLELTDYPEIKCFNLDPKVLKKWKIKETKGGVLEVPVTTMVPAHLMGSGIGALGVTRGDYDILTQDEKHMKKHGIDKIRLGDFVAIMDADNVYGRTWREGAVSIGVVIHCDSYLAGHGPGVMTVMTAAKPLIKPVISKKANVADLLGIGSPRK